MSTLGTAGDGQSRQSLAFALATEINSKNNQRR